MKERLRDALCRLNLHAWQRHLRYETHLSGGVTVIHETDRCRFYWRCGGERTRRV